MPRRKIAIEVTRECEVRVQPSATLVLKGATAILFEHLIKVGDAGITTRDFPGWDVRSYLRFMREAGIGFHDKREPNSLGGSHKRWWLREGYSYRVIPYPEKTKPVGGNRRTSNPKCSNGELKGFEDG